MSEALVNSINARVYSAFASQMLRDLETDLGPDQLALLTSRIGDLEGFLIQRVATYHKTSTHPIQVNALLKYLQTEINSKLTQSSN